MQGVSSLGVGSGIDIRNIVDQLVAAERAPVQSRLDRRETTLQAELSSFGTLKSALSEFRTAVSGLADAGSFRDARGTSGNAEAIEVAGNDRVQRAASFGIQVDALAEAQSLASAAFAGPAAEIGSGSLTFRFGTVSTDADGAVSGFAQNASRATATVAIPAEAATLADVRDAVNDADIGVRASVINDGSGERLVFSATATGAENGFVIDVADDDGDPADGAGLSRLQFNQTASELALNRAGSDASLVVDGLTVTRPGNQITDLLEGATLELKATTAVPVAVSVEPDVANARKLIDGSVDAYNALQQQIDSVSGFDAESQQGGVLQGDALVRSAEASLRRLVTGQVEALEGQSVRALADIGIRTSRDGTLEIDAARLDAQLADSLDEVAALFGAGGLVDGAGFAFESSRSETEPGRYGVEVTQLAEQAAITGSGVAVPAPGAPVVIDGSNDELELTVDGVATGRIRLTQGSYDSGAGTIAIPVSRPKASLPSSSTIKLRLLLTSRGNGWDGSRPMGFTTGRISSSK